MRMLCENCGKNPAQKFIRKTGGREIVVELCPACYRTLYPEKENDFFPAFLGSGVSAEKACPACGTTMAEFRRTGLLGCAYCYSAFREELLETVRNMHNMQGEVRHTGKRPEASAEENGRKHRQLSSGNRRLPQGLSAKYQARLSQNHAHAMRRNCRSVPTPHSPPCKIPSAKNRV